jgi:hypothetical protein
MKRPSQVALAAIALLSAVSALGQDGSPCEKISKGVREDVAKDPSKVLMVVEDALVVNESCACEIIRAAITASNADAALTKQIIETAVAVAPKMTPVIQDCAGMAQAPVAETVSETESESDKKEPAASGKSGSGKAGTGESVQPATDIQPPKEGGGAQFGQGGPVDIRGVYLTLPSAGGFITEEDLGVDPHDDERRRKTRTKIVRERKIVIVPVSPTQPNPNL